MSEINKEIIVCQGHKVAILHPGSGKFFCTIMNNMQGDNLYAITKDFSAIKRKDQREIWREYFENKLMYKYKSSRQRSNFVDFCKELQVYTEFPKLSDFFAVGKNLKLSSPITCLYKTFYENFSKEAKVKIQWI